MEIQIEFKDGTKTVQYYVKNSWVEDSLYCIRVAYMVVHKYPIETIARIKEVKDPTSPGERPDSIQIQKDFGYPKAPSYEYFDMGVSNDWHVGEPNEDVVKSLENKNVTEVRCGDTWWRRN